MTDEPEFLWGDELHSASQEELVTHIEELQQQMCEYETELEKIRETVHFMLDMQAGIGELYLAEEDGEPQPRETDR